MNIWCGQGAPEWADDFEMASSRGFWPFDPYVHDPSYEETVAGALASDLIATEQHKRARVLHRALAGAMFTPGYDAVGWSQPPRPADVIVSFDPRASRSAQARAVLYDYYHDDPLRYWADNEAVKRCFIGGNDPRKENHDPLLLIAAYENKNHPIWKCHGDKMTWHDMDVAVQQAIAHRKKLGALPKPSYDTDPLVIYYYDNDKMKRVTYPKSLIPSALNPQENHWWTLATGSDAVHTREADDPKKIQVERENPGWVTKAQKEKLKQKYSWISDMDSGSAGDWQSEGPTWDKDIAGTGMIASISGALLSIISTIADMTGVGAIIGVPLQIATPFIVASIQAADTALHAGDFGAAISNLVPALMNASASALSKSGVTLPPAAVKTLAGVVGGVANAVKAGQQQKLDFAQLWSQVASKAKSFGKIGDEQAHAIAAMIGGGPAGNAVSHAFIQGYLAGKFLDKTAIAGLSNILSAYKQFADPRVINLVLLGIGFGQIARNQSSSVFSTHGEFVGQALATKQYSPMPQSAVSALLARAQAAGLAVSGNNPWYIDTHEHGVKLQVVWDAASPGTVVVTVTDKYPYVSNDQIWERLDALAGASMTHVTGALSAKDRLHSFVQFRLVPRYTKHATTGPYDIVDDVHQDERIEAAQAMLNQLRGAKPGDVLFVAETGLLDPQTRQAVRNFQFEAGVGPLDGTPTDETLLALQAETERKKAIFAGEFVTGVGLDTIVTEGTLLYDAPNGHPISMVSERTRAMFVQRVGHWLQVNIDGTPVWIVDSTFVNEPVHAIPSEHDVLHAMHGTHFAGQTSLTPPPDYGALSRGCPLGSWWDPFTSTCRASTPMPMPPKPQPMPGPPLPMPLPVSPEMPMPMSTQGAFDEEPPEGSRWYGPSDCPPGREWVYRRSVHQWVCEPTPLMAVSTQGWLYGEVG